MTADTLRLAGERRDKRPRKRRRRTFRRMLGVVLTAILVVAALPLILLPLYRVVNPPVGAVMLWKAVGGAGVAKDWVALDNISPQLVRAVVSAEDARFCSHGGIDWVEVENALDDNGRWRGASTITMQTVKNLFLWTGRDWFRKGIEAPLALYAELVLSKQRILEIYLNIVEWGDGLYGVQAAARYYFGISAAELSAAQSARLAAILPAPLARDAAAPGPQTRRIVRRIAARAAQAGPHVACVFG